MILTYNDSGDLENWKATDSLELQNLDCNCNNCIFMIRDFETQKKWESFHYSVQLNDFERKKSKAIVDANNHTDERAKNGALRKANKMNLQFNKIGLIQYGNCDKLNKPVSFLPSTLQVETQLCFKNRRQ